jgi:hypothetical protein
VISVHSEGVLGPRNLSDVVGRSALMYLQTSAQEEDAMRDNQTPSLGMESRGSTEEH